MMPMTVNRSSSSLISRPTMVRSRSNRRCHKLSLRIATFGPLGRSSAAVNSRPTAGRTPSTRKYREVTRWPSRRSGCSEPVIVGCHGLITAIASSDRLRSSTSRYVPNVTSRCEPSTP
jgi:hypothetical protein